MARHRKKFCLYCYTPFTGRSDAKTCSDRCRKGLQRARSLFQAIEPNDPALGRSPKRYATVATKRSYYAGR